MTFLVNKRMHPALAARIEASVTGQRAMRGTPKPRTIAFARIAVFVAMALFVWAVLSFQQRAQVRGAGGPKPASAKAISSAAK